MFRNMYIYVQVLQVDLRAIPKTEMDNEPTHRTVDCFSLQMASTSSAQRIVSSTRPSVT